MPVQEFNARLLEMKDYTNEGELIVRVMKFSTEKAKDFSYKPGQFVMISVDNVMSPTDQTKLKQSAMSIASAPHEKGYIELCIKMHDKPGVSKYIKDKVKAGDEITVKGPFGVFGLVESQEQAVFVSTGTGIAPLMSMARHLVNAKFSKPVKFFYGCRRKENFLYGKELQQFAKSMKNFELNVICSRENFNGRQGHVQELLKGYKFKGNIGGTHAYVCGNPQAVEEIISALKETGLKAENIHKEQW